MRLKAPEAGERLARQVTAAVQVVRGMGSTRHPVSPRPSTGPTLSPRWGPPNWTRRRSSAPWAAFSNIARTSSGCRGATWPDWSKKPRGVAERRRRVDAHPPGGVRPQPPPRRRGRSGGQRRALRTGRRCAGDRSPRQGLLGGEERSDPPAGGRRDLRPGLRLVLVGPPAVVRILPHRHRSNRSTERGDDGRSPTDDDGEPPRHLALVSYSDVDQLRRKDFAACTPEELEEISRLLRETPCAATQRSRRMRRSRRDHGRHDPRATMRRTLRSGGEVVRLMHREPSRPRRVVLLCDVSGSMEPYARALLRFLHVAVAGQGRVEAFAVGTRLTRLTRQLSSRDPDAALHQATEQVLDWSGGTRLGEGIGTFNDRFGMPGMARGCDRGDPVRRFGPGRPDRLAGEMARLHRAALSDDLGQPAEGVGRVRAAGPGDGGRTALCRPVRRGPFRRLARCAGGRDRRERVRR